MNAELHCLRIFSRDDEFPEIAIQIPELGDPTFLSLGTERPVTLPNEEVLDVYAEVSLAGPIPDISLSIIQGERALAVRCGAGLVVSYTTRGNLEVLFQIGTGAWDQ